MPQGHRPDRVAEEIRQELGTLLQREVHDPGIGFVTITRVHVTGDLQLARVYYTTLGDQKARAETARALRRALPFLRRQIGQRLRLRRVPEVEFRFDQGVENENRVERILQDLHAEEEARAAERASPEEPATGDPDDE